MLSARSNKGLIALLEAGLPGNRVQRRGRSQPALRRCVLEALEPRQLLSAAVMLDQLDYAPGSIAQITTLNDARAGLNFQAGETVRFQVTRTDGQPDYPSGNLPWLVTDGVGGFDPYQDADGTWVYPDLDGAANGTISTTWYVEQQYANSSLLLTATGLSSQATAQIAFTDATIPTVKGTWTATDTGSSARTTLAVNVNAAVPQSNSIIVAVALKTTSSAGVTVTDARGNTYRKDVDVVNASGARLVVFSSLLTTALVSGDAITVTTPAGISDKAMEVSWTSAVTFDKYSSMTDSSILPTSNGVIPTTSGAGYLVLGMNAAVTSGAETSHGNPGNPWIANASAQSNAGAASNTIIYTVREGAYGSTTALPYTDLTYNAIGTLSSGGPWAAGILLYKELAPSSTISFPANNGLYNASTWTGTISGTASEPVGPGVQKVELQIKNVTRSQYWNGTSWSGTATTYVLATGTTNWTYAFAAANMTNAYQYSITTRVTDNGGNTGASTTTFKYDTAAPAVSSFFAQYPTNGAPSSSVPPLLTSMASDTNNVTAAEYFIDATGANGTGIPMTGGFPNTTVQPTATIATATFNSWADGSSHTLYMHAVDAAGNWSGFYATTVKKDLIAPTSSNVSFASNPAKTAPTFSATLSDTNGWGSNLWYWEYFVDTLGANGTGVKTTLTSNPAMPTSGSPNANVSVSAIYSNWVTLWNSLADGTHTLYVHAQDVAGNWGTAATATFVKDTTGPVTSAALAGTMGNNGWYTSPVTVTLSATDVSGVASTSYSIDGGPMLAYSVPLSVSAEGAHNVSFYSTDNVGNIETPAKTIAFKIDTPPVVTISAPANTTYGAPTTISGTWTAGLSGVNQITLNVYDTTDFGGYVGIAAQGSPLTAVQGVQATINPNGTWTYTFTPIAAAVGSGTANVEAAHWFVAASITDGNGISGSAPNSATFAIDKATLTITANNQSKVYGTPLNLGTSAFSIAGLVNGDTVTGVTLSSVGASASATAGTYAITASAAVGTGLSNYTINYVSGALNVAPINVTSSLSMTPGGFRYNPATKLFYQTVTIKVLQPITGPVSIVLTNIKNATLVGATGVYGGNSYLSLGSVSVGQTISLTLAFNNPTLAGISYGYQFLAGL